MLAINLHKLFVHLFLKLQELFVKNSGSLTFSLLYTLLQDLALFAQLLDDFTALLQVWSLSYCALEFEK